MSRFLAAFRASEPTASKKRFFGTYGADNPEKGGNPPPPSACPPAGGGGRGFRDCGDHTSGKAAFLNAAQAAAAALAAPDPALDHERAEIAAALAGPAAADPWHPGKPDPLRDGLLTAALARPPSWSDPASPPPAGAWCSCCGRSHRSGGRWWREAAEPKGWRCGRCHPADHLRVDQVVEVRT